MKGRLIGSAARIMMAGLLMLGVAGAATAASLEEIKDRGYIRIAIANEIPYGWMTTSGQAKGFGPDIAKKVLQKMGIEEIQWTVTEFGSLIPALKAGRVDMVAAEQAVLPQRCQQVDFSHPNTTYGEGLLVAADNPQDIHGYQDFIDNPDLTLGIVSGADQLEIGQAVGIPMDQMVMLQANTDAVSAVATGRIDAYAATELTAARLAQKSDRVTTAEPFHDPVVGGEPARSWGAFTFDSESDELRMAFNKALEEVQSTQYYHDTLKQYGLSEHAIEAVDQKTTEELCSGEGHSG